MASCLQWPASAAKRSSSHINGGLCIGNRASPLTAAEAASRSQNHARTYDVIGFHSRSNGQLTSTTSCHTDVTTITDGGGAEIWPYAGSRDCVLHDRSKSVSRSTSVVELSCLWQAQNDQHAHNDVLDYSNQIDQIGCIQLGPAAGLSSFILDPETGPQWLRTLFLFLLFLSDFWWGSTMTATNHDDPTWWNLSNDVKWA